MQLPYQDNNQYKSASYILALFVFCKTAPVLQNTNKAIFSEFNLKDCNTVKVKLDVKNKVLIGGF